MTSDLKPEAQEVLNIVAASASKLTPPVLEKILSENYHLEKKEIRTLVKDLVARGELTYTYEFGSTFLETAFNKALRISDSVVIKPSALHYQPQSGDVVVQIKPGAAFGDGRHPTTRLAIRGIEYVLKDLKLDKGEHQNTVLDIGTGSGILLLAAVGLGMHGGMGIDIDPCARFEARHNIKINGLEDRIEISDHYLETIDQTFLLVTANLRSPTLKEICPCLRKITAAQGFLVFSGIRPHELTAVMKTYARKNFATLWKNQEQDWVAVVLRRSS